MTSDRVSIDGELAEMEVPEAMAGCIDIGKACVNAWLDQMNKKNLTGTDFKEHWRTWVPKIYCPEPNGNYLDCTFDEGKAEKVLFAPLEEFICNGEPRSVLKELRSLENPPTVCGKVFKFGEPTYNCRECSLDPTCVLCMDCFKQSSHKDHKYKMGMSHGGGCCDCGDAEAWKKDYYCKIHAPPTEVKESESTLPADMSERTMIVFGAVLKYCYDLLTVEHSPSLPAYWCIRRKNEEPDELLFVGDTYCTVLFNDETHTFEQVISTLTRVMKCSQRNAVEFVTSIDREGRAVVKCSGFQYCDALKAEIERFTSKNSNRPLKVLVIHSHVIAHQTFAMKLLGWLQQFISTCKSFRLLFSKVALHAKLPEMTIVEGILICDSLLWKSARTAWHKLFITGMLMEYESKKDFAIVFTQFYGTVMKDFIRDDHDQTFSIVSFAVQLYTVPTLAHYLIAHHDALFITLNTLISETSRRCNSAGKLEFDRNTPNIAFKRALCIAYDIRYLLSTVPEVWTTELRRGFLHGFSLLLTLLSSMNRMDPVVRQVGQHMEYEPEWETGFQTHIRLSSVITSALEWCGSDRVVLIKAFRQVLLKLHEQSESYQTIVRELADHSATCLQYDVMTFPVSLHLPLLRFLAGLFLHLEKYNLNFQSPEFSDRAKLSPEQIIEPLLSTLAMISQVHAGMWRRNGYSLVNQLYFYQSPRCRTEMLDKDIVLLQVGATLIESNEFIIHLLNRFNLLNWASSDYETKVTMDTEADCTRQTITLVEEFLGLLIAVIGERYVPGVGQVTYEDCLKKEIIQELCIKDLSHSELERMLPDNSQVESEMENLVLEVADFKKPQETGGKALYTLKTNLYSEYNVFFYHYTKEELTRSEEVQRKRKKARGELECCPPPKLPKLTESFSLLANLLQCDVMLHIMRTVLERARHFTTTSFSEPQVHRVLHLIGYALQEQESGNYPFLAFPERAAKWKIFNLLESLSSSSRIEAHKDLLTWILERYREVTGSANTPDDASGGGPALKSSELSRYAVSNETKKEWSTKMAAQRRAKIMAQMESMQKHFMKKYANLFEEDDSDQSSPMECAEYPDTDVSSVALGPNQTTRMTEQKAYVCILCQEQQIVTASSRAMVSAAFVQQSIVLCQNRSDPIEPDSLYLSSNLGATPYISTCGHVMHSRCWLLYYDNIITKENARSYRIRHISRFDVEQDEFLCPLCECMGNTVLPILPALGSVQTTVNDINAELNFETWLKAVRLVLQSKGNGGERRRRRVEKADVEENDEQARSEVGEGAEMPLDIIKRELGDGASSALASVYGRKGPAFSNNILTVIRNVFKRVCSKAHTNGSEPMPIDSQSYLIVWKSIAYTVHAIEVLLRETDKPILDALSSRQRNSMEALARLSAILGCVDISCGNNGPSWTDKSAIIGEHALSLLTLLLENPHAGPCVLDWDAFGVLVTLINALPSLFGPDTFEPPTIVTCGLLEYYALQLVFISHITRILLTSVFTEGMDIDGQQELEEERTSDSLLMLLEALNVQRGGGGGGGGGGLPSAGQLWAQVKEASLPFLRCCALYFRYVSDVPSSEALTKEGGDTYENLCAYLGLPTTCDQLILPNREAIMTLIERWRSHPTVESYLSGASRSVAVIREPLKFNKLVDLPEDYSELINAISLFTCPNRDKEDSRSPTMCLICGEMLCSQSYCCQAELNKTQVGACTYHASKCGAGTGIFLRVRECEILLLRIPNRGSFICAPYLDEYGEADQGLRRGNPLRLCPVKYRQFNLMWLGHGLYESISRTIESPNNIMTTHWRHL